jgi:hypothetical protein
MAMAHQVHTYTELRQQIHHDLRIPHKLIAHYDWLVGSSIDCEVRR